VGFVVLRALRAFVVKSRTIFPVLPFVTPWPDVSYALSFEQRVEIQKLLYRRGFDPGGTDGRFGARTYEAILGFQNKSGMKLDGVPTAGLLERLRKGS